MPLNTLHDLIDEFDGRGDAPALLSLEGEDVETWSYRDLRARIGRVAGGLKGAGVQEEHFVALVAENSPAWIVGYFSIVSLGATAVPIDHATSEKERQRLLAHAGARLALIETGDAERGAPDLRRIGDDGDIGERLADWAALLDSGPAEAVAVNSDRVASLLYTSGTTGTPKGVPLTHGNFASNVEGLLTEDMATPGDRMVLPLPLHHAYPFTVGMLTTFAVGATLVMPERIAPEAIGRALRKTDATILVGVPRLFTALLAGIEAQVKARGTTALRLFRAMRALSIFCRRRLGIRIGRRLFRQLHSRFGPSLRLLASGGAKLEADTAWSLEALGWEVLTGYGLTETSPVVTFTPRGRPRFETAGKPLPGVELRFSEVEELDQPEIEVKGPNLFSGYLRNDEETREAITGDGWFRTGDLGALDDDGFLRITGRRKELIVLPGGKNIVPEELEAKFLDLDLVGELAVFEHGDGLAALVVPDLQRLREAGTGRPEARLQEDMEERAQTLPGYQRLSAIAVTRTPLPRTRLGKIRRHLIPDMFEKARAGEEPDDAPLELSEQDRRLLEQPRAAQVWEWLQQRYPDVRLRPDTSPQMDLGIDSMGWISLTMEMQAKFGFSLSDEAISRVLTLRDLLEEVEKAEEGAPEVTIDESRLEPPGPALRLLGRAMFALNRVLMRGAYRLHVEGAEHLDGLDRVLIAPNHLSSLDPLAVAAACDYARLHRTFWAGWTGIMFKGPVTRAISRAARVLPVDPERGATDALAYGEAALARDCALVWFPEGRRSRTGRLQRFGQGIGMLAHKTGAPVVPVRIDGTYEALPPGKLLPGTGRLSVRFEPPVAVEDLDREGEGETAAARITDALYRRAARWEPEQEREQPV